MARSVSCRETAKVPAETSSWVSWQGDCERDCPKLFLEGDKLDPNCRGIAVKDTRST